MGIYTGISNGEELFFLGSQKEKRRSVVWCDDSFILSRGDAVLAEGDWY